MVVIDIPTYFHLFSNHNHKVLSLLPKDSDHFWNNITHIPAFYFVHSLDISYFRDNICIVYLHYYYNCKNFSNIIYHCIFVKSLHFYTYLHKIAEDTFSRNGGSQNHF